MIGHSAVAAVVARLDELVQRAAHRLQVRDLLIDVLDLALGDGADPVPLAAPHPAQAHQLLDLVEREAELLRLLDEADDADGVGGIFAVA